MGPQPFTPYLRTLALRNLRTFSAAAQAKPAASEGSGSYIIPREEIKTTKVSNIQVASIETNKPVAKLAVYFKAGSRYEQYDNLGVVNALRIFSALGTANSTHFGIVRHIEQAGGNLYCTAGREHIAYTLEAPRDNIQSLEKFLQDATLNQKFNPWELTDHMSRLKLDLDQRTPEIRVLELLHRISFRDGLGNSLYTPKSMVGKHSTQMLLDYVKNNFTEASVVALGYPHQSVVDFASRLKLQGGSQNVTPAKFYSGETRQVSGTSHAYVALALEGASVKNSKELMASSAVQLSLGIGPRTKYGNVGGKLFSAVSDAIETSTATALQASYSDAGLIGAVIVSTPCCVEKVTKKVSQILRTANFTDEDANNAKNMLKSIVAQSSESDDGLIEDLGLQSLIEGKVSSFEEQAKLIDSVSASDMNNILRKGKGKMSMACYGNLKNVPYLDELN